MSSRLLENMNPQQQGIRTVDGPVLLLAGAGSGKTRVVHLSEPRCPMRPYLVLLASTGLLTGCALPTNQSATAVSSSARPISGAVHGGQQPISGATIQLWQVGTTGYGTGAAPLGSSTTTASDGTFSITGAYSCSNAASTTQTPVYITATGGDPGLGTPNPAILLTAALGLCGNLYSSTFIAINEVTTVATAYALGQFASPAANIGSYSSAPGAGLYNAFATVQNLVVPSSGAARSMTLTSNGLVPQAEINSLANILAGCVNSSGGSANDGTACGNLFAAAQPPSGSAPTNVFAAALDIALNPGNNVAALFDLPLPDAPFQPALSAAPNDWTMAVDFAGTSPTTADIDIDASGYIWAINSSTISRLTNQGISLNPSPISFSSGLSAIAIDLNGYPWIANASTNQVTGLDFSGNIQYGPFQFSETNQPVALAVDPGNNIWVVNSGSNSLTELGHSSGSVVNISPQYGYTGGGLSSPAGIAIDTLGNAWVANSGANTFTRVAALGTSSTSYTGSALGNPVALAIDSAFNLWFVNSTLTGLGEFTSSGNQLGSTITGGGLTASAHNTVAIDGLGTVWVTNTAASTLSAISSAGTALSPATGFIGAPVTLFAPATYQNLNSPGRIRIDSSGNVWVANAVSLPISSTQNSQLTEFIGLAAPVVTPLSVAASQSRLGKRPGDPIH